jgi:hypothetical protein
MSGGDEEDAIQTEAFGGLAGQREMPEMHGIEGAAEDR